MKADFFPSKMWKHPVVQFYKKGDELKFTSLYSYYERQSPYFNFIFDRKVSPNWEIEPSPSYSIPFFLANGEILESWRFPPDTEMYRGCGYDGIRQCYAKIRENGKEGYINIMRPHVVVPSIFTEDYEDIKKGTLVYVTRSEGDKFLVRPFLTSSDYSRYVPANIVKGVMKQPEVHVPFPM